MVLKWFNAADSERFGKELAQFILSELQESLHKRDAKFAAKAGKTLGHAAARVQEFESREAMNCYKKSKLANAFLWALKDAGCLDEYANVLTDWRTVRL